MRAQRWPAGRGTRQVGGAGHTAAQLDEFILVRSQMVTTARSQSAIEEVHGETSVGMTLILEGVKQILVDMAQVECDANVVCNGRGRPNCIQ